MRSDLEPRGELNLRAARGEYRAARFLPSEDLASEVAYYWLVAWDREGRAPYDQQVLTQPLMHIVFERDDVSAATSSRVVGVSTRRFTRRLAGRGHVVGVAFHPGALVLRTGHPAHSLRDRMVPLRDVLARDSGALERSILERRTAAARVGAVEAFLRADRPAAHPAAAAARALVERARDDEDIGSVGALIAATGLGKRTVQRLFERYVGIGPKWVIRRFRLIEAARRLEDGSDGSLAGLASALGYFDQAHFIKDFRSIVGTTPSDYRRLTGEPTSRRS